MGDIQQDIICAAAFHFGIDRARHDVARGEVLSGIIPFHESGAVEVRRMPPSPRTASLMRNDLALGYRSRWGGTA